MMIVFSCPGCTISFRFTAFVLITIIDVEQKLFNCSSAQTINRFLHLSKKNRSIFSYFYSHPWTSNKSVRLNIKRVRPIELFLNGLSGMQTSATLVRTIPYLSCTSSPSWDVTRHSITYIFLSAEEGKQRPKKKKKNRILKRK